jgi:hypothetical protein
MAEIVVAQLKAALAVMIADGLFVAALMAAVGRYMKNWLTRYVSGAVFAGILCSFLERPEESYPAYFLAGLIWVAVGHIALIVWKLKKR